MQIKISVTFLNKAPDYLSDSIAGSVVPSKTDILHPNRRSRAAT